MSSPVTPSFVEPSPIAYNPHPGQPEPARDFWGRPYVIPPTGGKAVPYTRCTTLVGAVEDYYLLSKWQQRHAARGVAHHEDLIAAIKDTEAEDKQRMDELVEEAKERSGAGDAARFGTYLHAVTEAADRGLEPGEVPLPWLSSGPLDPNGYLSYLASYVEATAELQAVMIEQFCVQDPLKTAGTPDRVVKYQGKRFIADLKTGHVDLGSIKIAAQLAVYARSRPYDWQTGERLEPHGAELDRGIVVHLDAKTSECQLYWIDLLQGWEAVRVARDVRSTRAVRFNQLMRELRPIPPAPLDLADQIKLAPSRDAVTSLWEAHEAEWTPELTELAKAHIAALAGTTPIHREAPTTP
jgi:hypothetical protein